MHLPSQGPLHGAERNLDRGVGKTTWPRYREDLKGGWVGCQVCTDYVAAGHRLHGRQALGRFEMEFARAGQARLVDTWNVKTATMREHWPTSRCL